MRRIVAILCLAGLAAPGCGEANNDERELRGFLRKTVAGPRTFSYRELSKERSFTVRGEVEDDLRFRMVLSTDSGDLMEEIVSDDVLAVRFLRPEIAAAIPSSLGSVPVDAALRAGKWALSPSGAPPLLRPGSSEELGEVADPFRAALEDIRYVGQTLSQAAGVRELNLEDLDYRSKEDPWEYPDKDAKEKRYDLLRPFLPKREEQLGGPQGQQDVTTANFRKLSAFIGKGRVYQVCEMVDVAGHEDYVKAKKEKKKNKFLLNLVKRVLEGKTARPIRQREVVRTIEFPKEVAVQVPSDAVKGSLEPLQTALVQAFQGGVLAPSPASALEECDRRGVKD